MGKKKLSDEECMQIRKDLLEGSNEYLLSRQYKVSITTIQNARLRALAIERGLTWEEAVSWKKNAYAVDIITGKPLLG